MIDFDALVKGAKELTNVVSLIEKNLAAFGRIRASLRRKRIAEKLDKILAILTTWQYKNANALWHLGRYSKNGTLDPKELQSNFYYDSELSEFYQGLLATKKMLEEYRSDIVSVDHALYEQLQWAVNNRMVALSILSDDKTLISREKIEALYVAYEELVRSLSSLKDNLQETAQRVYNAKGDVHPGTAIKKKKSSKPRVSKQKRNELSAPQSRRLPSQE